MPAPAASLTGGWRKRRTAHAGVKAAAASPRLPTLRVPVIPILQLRKARAVPVFAYRSALDPRQNTQVFWFQIEAEIAEQRGMQIAASSPALCVLFATQASMFSAARGPSPTSAALLCRRPAMPVPACLEVADNPWFNYGSASQSLTGRVSQ